MVNRPALSGPSLTWQVGPAVPSAASPGLVCKLTHPPFPQQPVSLAQLPVECEEDRISLPGCGTQLTQHLCLTLHDCQSCIAP